MNSYSLFNFFFSLGVYSKVFIFRCFAVFYHLIQFCFSEFLCNLSFAVMTKFVTYVRNL